jgi:Ser/Thr protein kinase RdoA (MazF antagonist)
MDRADIALVCERDVLESAARLFGTSREALGKFDDYEGCTNLVYRYERDGQARVLRISYRTDRSVEQIQAELHFINHLAEGGVRVSVPVRSVNGNLIEVLPAEGMNFIAASFVKGKGSRVPDNQYRYREGVPLEEYYQDWGQVLGQMHRLAKTYQPPGGTLRRPEWHTCKPYQGFPFRERLPVVGRKYDQLIADLRALPKDVNSYGLIHNDFYDGNFTLDYDTGELTVFDFDDCCYFWFMYELACAWESGLGRARTGLKEERRAFMDRYMGQVLAGYTRENSLSDDWLARLPLFLRVVEMLELMHFAQYLDDPDEKLQARLKFKIHCVENDIPFLGFFQ